MTIQTITGTVASARKDNAGFKIDDDWYSVYKNDTNMKSVVADIWKKTVTVTFKTAPRDDGGEWRNVQTIEVDGTTYGGKTGPKYGGGGGNTGTTTKAGPGGTKTTPTATNGDYTNLNAWTLFSTSQNVLKAIKTPEDAYEAAKAFKAAQEAYNESERVRMQPADPDVFAIREQTLAAEIGGLDTTSEAWVKYRTEQFGGCTTKEEQDMAIAFLEQVRDGAWVMMKQPSGSIAFQATSTEG